MTPADLAAIRERANNATEGPWEYVDDYFGVRQVPTEAHRTGRTEYEVEGIVPGEYIRDYDAVFIAHARVDVPALLDHVDALTARLAAVREIHRERPNSTSALYPNPLCSCGKEYPCPTIQAIDPPK